MRFPGQIWPPPWHGNTVRSKYGLIRCSQLASRTNHKKMYKELSEDYRRLLAQHQEMRREIKALKNDNEELRKENEKLRRHLAYHDNANTPPSRKMPTAKRSKKTGTSKDGNGPSGKETPPRRRGAQPGHKGKTSRPAPTEYETHAPLKCPGCRSTSLNAESVEVTDITEIPRPVKATTVRHHLVTCRCGGCGLGGIEPNADLPRGGSYGRNVVATVVHNFLDRLPGRLNADSMGRHGIAVSTGTIHNILSGTGSSLGEPALEVRDRIRKARLLHVDEMSVSLNGRNVWIWIFLNPETGDVYYTIRPSRGPEVIREVLGERWSGTIICDGWSAYKRYSIQRCCAHILREADRIADRNEHCRPARDVADALRRICRDGTGAKGPPGHRRALRDALRKRVSRIIANHQDHPVLEKFMTKLANALPNLFRFVTDPSIPTTNNNAAERGLRELVVHRKVRGSIRSEKTMDWMASIFTCVTTWKVRGIDYMAQMAAYV